MTGDPPLGAVPPDIATGMRAAGVTLGPTATAEPLSGGVSSDIWHVVDGDRHWCAKRALRTLRTTAHWEAPVERSANEAAWLRAAHPVAPDAVPAVCGFDDATHLLVLEYLPADRYRTWKQDLLVGEVDPEVARSLGATLGRLHRDLATDDQRRRFDHPDLILALRLEPYLLRTAQHHHDLAPYLEGLVERFHREARTVVHGDVSPKNVLTGDGRVVLLDAECATWGDPGFDVAFCLTHLCAKAVHLPDRSAALRVAADAFVDAHAAASADAATDGGGGWLPALLLARVDGASPLEYLDDDSRHRIRELARSMMHTPEEGVRPAIARWFDALQASENGIG